MINQVYKELARPDFFYCNLKTRTSNSATPLLITSRFIKEMSGIFFSQSFKDWVFHPTLNPQNFIFHGHPHQWSLINTPRLWRIRTTCGFFPWPWDSRDSYHKNSRHNQTQRRLSQLHRSPNTTIDTPFIYSYTPKLPRKNQHTTRHSNQPKIHLASLISWVKKLCRRSEFWVLTWASPRLSFSDLPVNLYTPMLPACRPACRQIKGTQLGNVYSDKLGTPTLLSFSEPNWRACKSEMRGWTHVGRQAGLLGRKSGVRDSWWSGEELQVCCTTT